MKVPKPEGRKMYIEKDESVEKNMIEFIQKYGAISLRINDIKTEIISAEIMQEELIAERDLLHHGLLRVGVWDVSGGHVVIVPTEHEGVADVIFYENEKV